MTRQAGTRRSDLETESPDTQGSNQDNSQRRVNPNNPVGDPLEVPKENNNMRIYMQNPNGISIGKMGDMDMTLDHLKHMEVDIFVFPETNLDTH
jgi:hypothetical protein